ncbi:MAG TPA: bacillithiol system redox-active protein YtxJ [Chryseosolibacter sp.]
MKWNQLRAADQLEEIKKESSEKKILIFKHSTRCNISRASLDRLERNWNEQEMQDVKPYFLDLLNYREISNKIVQQFNVEHESPQILLIDNGKAILDQSHFSIDYDQIKAAAKS